MRDEFMRHFALDGQRVQITFVPLDKFLDGYFCAIGHTGLHQYLFQFAAVPNFPGACGAGAGRWLDNQWKPGLAREFPGGLWFTGTG